MVYKVHIKWHFLCTLAHCHAKNNGPRFLQNLFACQFCSQLRMGGGKSDDSVCMCVQENREKLCQSLHLLRTHSILHEQPTRIFYSKLTIQFHLHFNGKMCLARQVQFNLLWAWRGVWTLVLDRPMLDCWIVKLNFLFDVSNIFSWFAAKYLASQLQLSHSRI